MYVRVGDIDELNKFLKQLNWEFFEKPLNAAQTLTRRRVAQLRKNQRDLPTIEP